MNILKIKSDVIACEHYSEPLPEKTIAENIPSSTKFSTPMKKIPPRERNEKMRQSSAQIIVLPQISLMSSGEEGR